MIYMNVKNSTPTTKWMQIVCLAGATWLMATALCHAQSKPVSTQAPIPAAGGAVASQRSPLIGSQAAMFNQVKTWLSDTHKLKTDQVQIAPLDPRVQVPNCPKSLTIDHPFSSKDTVRVRCADPVWQIYLQVSMPAAAKAAQAATSNPSSGSVSPSGAVNSNPAPKTVVVPKRLIQRGTVIESDMLEEVTQQGGNMDSSLLQSTKDALAAEAVRDLSAGQALRVSDIRRAILVKQGQLVTMTVGDKSGFLITVRVEALQDGRMGEQVKLKNTESGRQISGIVTGPNLVKGVQ
jgi:flagella basal body P-ring formation protein FlgA